MVPGPVLIHLGRIGIYRGTSEYLLIELKCEKKSTENIQREADN